jgi:hypothetical protein
MSVNKVVTTVAVGVLGLEQITHGDEKHIHQDADTDAPRQMSRAITVTSAAATSHDFGPLTAAKFKRIQETIDALTLFKEFKPKE